MRNLLITLSLLLALTVSACYVDTQPFNPQNSVAFARMNHDPWRRTSQGWEKNYKWEVEGKGPSAAYIHPGLVASFQLLACVGGLLAASPVSRLATTQDTTQIVA